MSKIYIGYWFHIGYWVLTVYWLLEVLGEVLGNYPIPNPIPRKISILSIDIGSSIGFEPNTSPNTLDFNTNSKLIDSNTQIRFKNGPYDMVHIWHRGRRPSGQRRMVDGGRNFFSESRSPHADSRLIAESRSMNFIWAGRKRTKNLKEWRTKIFASKMNYSERFALH